MKPKYTPHQKKTVETIVHLMQENRLKIEDVSDAWRQALPASDTPHLTWVHFFYYLGALCILSGLISYYTVYWRFISVTALSLSSALLGTAAFLVGSIWLYKMPEATEPKARRYPYALLCAGAFFQLSGLVLAFDDFASVLLKPQTVGMLIFAVLAISAWLGVCFMRREPFVAMGITYSSLFVMYVFDCFAWSSSILDIVLGLALCAVAYYLSAQFKSLYYRMWYILGSTILQIGFFDLVFKKKTELLFVGLIAGLLLISTRLREKVLFFSATIGLLAYVNTLIYRYLAKSFNVPMLFSIAGFCCILIGLALNRWYKKNFPEASP